MPRKVNWKQTPSRTLSDERRKHTFEEVNQGYTLQEAIVEAQRCLQCPSPACQEGCPNGNPIREFIALLAEGDIVGAARLDWSQNALPSCTGRVCAWEAQCEGFCVMGKRGDPIKIGALERFIADYALEHAADLPPEHRNGPTRSGNGASPYPRPLRALPSTRTDNRREQRVAVIGAGPAGLTAAHFLARYGYPVTVFESWPIPGGVMAYGIPEFVLPQKVIDREVERIRRMGVEIRTGVTIGKDLTIDDLFAQGFAAVFIGVGSNQAATLNIPGEELDGVWTAKEFLMRIAAWNLRDRMAGSWPPETLTPPRVGKRVAIVGAGNTAMDAARCAIRLGAEEVTVLYRRTADQSPSRPIEVEHARHEGVQFRYLVNPVRFLGDKEGRLRAVELVRMHLVDTGGSGRPRPVPIPGSEHIMPVDTCIVAVGYRPETLVAETGGLRVDRWGRLEVDPETGATNREGVFAAGDCVTGPKTVVHAIASARKAAEAIDAYLQRRAARALAVCS